MRDLSYTLDGIPEAVERHAATPDTLPAGSPGKVGVLDLDFAVRGERTELVGHYQKTPLQIMRTLYYDPARPDLPYVLVMSSGGGILQADRLRIDIAVREGASVHVTTQAATKVHRMEHDYATQRVGLTVEAGGYLEYLPDPVIPHRDSRLYQRTTLTIDPSATAILGETLLAGRLAHGERHDYAAFCADLEARDPAGRLLFADAVRLVPADAPVTGPAVFGPHDAMSTLYVVSRELPAQELADALHTAAESTGLRAGASVLPGAAGAWVRVLASSPEAVEALTLLWDTARRLLIGVPAPDRRRP